MSRPEKKKFSYYLVWASIFLLYFSSELILRVYFIYGDGNSAEKLKALTRTMPMLTEPLEAKRRRDDTRKALDLALKENDQKEIIKAYYAHGGELEIDDRRALYKEMLAKYPEAPECIEAFISLLEENGDIDLQALFQFKDKYPLKHQNKIISSAWVKVSSFSLKAQEIYLHHLVEKEYVSAEFFNIYKQLQSLSFKLNLSKKEDDKLIELRDRSFQKLKAQIDRRGKR